MLKKGVLIECQHLCSHIGIACVGIWHEDILGRKESAISFNFILSFFSVSNKNKDYLTMVKKDRIAESRSLIELRTNGITNNPFSIAVYIKKFKSSQFKICYQGYNKTKRRKSPLLDEIESRAEQENGRKYSYIEKSIQPLQTDIVWNSHCGWCWLHYWKSNSTWVH